jgi:hypothetical protein
MPWNAGLRHSSIAYLAFLAGSGDNAEKKSTAQQCFF